MIDQKSASWYFLQGNLSKEDMFIEKIEAKEGLDRQMLSGEVIPFTSPVLTIRLPQIHKKFTDLLGTGSWFIVSERFKNLLQEICGNDIQFLGTETITHTHKSIPDYFLAHILHPMLAIDLDRSDLEFFPGTQLIRRVSHLVLKEAELLHKHIFTDHMLGHADVFVSETIKRAMETQGITGVIAIPVSEYKLFDF